jgi:hypothetical protein
MKYAKDALALMIIGGNKTMFTCLLRWENLSSSKAPNTTLTKKFHHLLAL